MFLRLSMSTESSPDMEGRIVLITGSTSGLGGFYFISLWGMRTLGSRQACRTFIFLKVFHRLAAATHCKPNT